jgi:hypothetical protein
MHPALVFRGRLPHVRVAETAVVLERDVVCFELHCGVGRQGENTTKIFAITVKHMIHEDTT